MASPVFRSAFESHIQDDSGKVPLVFDIIGPNGNSVTGDLKMVLHANPRNLSLQYEKATEYIQTYGGFVVQHWGDSPTQITLEAASGGFMRMYSGLSSATGPSLNGSRRDTIAYDKYLDTLALYNGNGAVYDKRGNVAFQGKIQLSFNGATYLGWFQSFSVSESAEKPYMFSVSLSYMVESESHTVRHG